MPEDGAETPPAEIPPETPDIPETSAEAKDELEAADEELRDIGEELIDAYMRLERAEERIEILESYYMTDEEASDNGKRDEREATPEAPTETSTDRPPAAGHRYWRRRDK